VLSIGGALIAPRRKIQKQREIDLILRRNPAPAWLQATIRLWEQPAVAENATSIVAFVCFIITKLPYLERRSH
jgi:hypothetical protein